MDFAVDVLIAFKSRIVHDPDNVLASWDVTLADACTWFHVTCDAHNRVIRLYVILANQLILNIDYHYPNLFNINICLCGN